MIYIFPAFLLGILVSSLLMRRENADLKLNNEMLLDFNEKLIRDRDELELRYKAAMAIYLNHRNSHVCVEVPKEEEWPEEVSFQ